MLRPPTNRTRALETLLAKIRRANACLVNYEMWSDRGRELASPAEAATIEADYAQATRDIAECRPALDALVAMTRVEAPLDIAGWVDAHDAYLAAFIRDAAERGYDASFAKTARAKWAEVRVGTCAYVEDSGGVTESTSEDVNRFRWCFGLDPKTLEAVFVPKPGWYLKFRPPPSTQITIEACASALSAASGGPVQIDIGELSGNPRDFYGRGVTITASPSLSLSISQQMMGEDDPNPFTDLNYVTIGDAADATFATKLSLWHKLRDSFAAVGCTDITLASSPAPIVDEAIAAGELEIAARLRKEITAALVAQAATQKMIDLRATRPDDFEAVLAAYPAPLGNGWVSISDCGLSAMPPGLARFAPDITSLMFEHANVDGPGLRGVALPKLEGLYLSYGELRSLGRDDLAGFPELAELFVNTTMLETLDPAIIEVCPKLRRVAFAGTPFAEKTELVSALRAKWTGVVRWD